MLGETWRASLPHIELKSSFFMCPTCAKVVEEKYYEEKYGADPVKKWEFMRLQEGYGKLKAEFVLHCQCVPGPSDRR